MNKFAESDIPLLEALSASIAIAIRNARLYRSEVWRRQVTESFQEITSLVSANAALDNLLEKILTELDRSLPCDATAIWLLDSATPDQVESLHPARVQELARIVSGDNITETALRNAAEMLQLARG